MTFCVLVVDDNEDHRFLTRRALASALPDLSVLLAGSGEAALAILSRERVDLVLLDVKMPGLDGFDVLRRLRAEEATRALPVVMFSSSENAADQARAEALGASGFATKPLDPKGFTRLVRETVLAWAARGAPR